MNLFDVFESGDVVLVSVFVTLLLMSLISWYMIFWKGLKFYKQYNLYKKFHKEHITTPDWAAYLSSQEAQGVVKILIDETKKLSAILPNYNREGQRDIISMHLSQTLDIIRSWLDKGLTVLASIGSSAPFIGLFGTVWGIYGALIIISDQQSAGINVVAGPMGEALVATAFGLFAAIPAVLAYNGFVRLNRLLVQDLRHIAEQMTIYLSLPKNNKGEEK